MISDSIRMKVKVIQEITEVKVLINHPMETGSRVNKETGQPIPAHFIQEISCEHKGKVVMTAIWGSGISTDPFCAFQFKGGKVGDKISFSWKDNLGENSFTEIEIVAG